MFNNLAQTQDVQSIELYLSSAQDLQEQGKDSLAIEKYLQAIEIEPNSLIALDQLGKIYETKQQPDQAVSYYQRLVKLQPQNSSFYAKLARAMMSQSNFKSALAVYRKAVLIRPDSAAWVYQGLGDALVKTGQFKDAIMAYRRALKQQPHNPEYIEQKLAKVLDLAQENPLKKIARQIQKEAPYTGGPIQHFEQVGRETIITLLQNGLRPDHKILDFGCGALRLGYWIMRLVERGNYYGIEPDVGMLKSGLKYALGANLMQAKRPKFSTNRECDFSVFDVEFDFVVARSILTHSTPAMLRSILSSFHNNSAQNGIMLASYWPLEYQEPEQNGEIGDQLALTDNRFIPVVKYSFKTIQDWSNEFGLKVSELRVNPLINEQVWLRFEQA